MSPRRSLVAGGIALALAVLGAPSNDAHACGGGFFTRPSEAELTRVTGHRVVISMSSTQTVLWDQVQYDGDPSEFAWVLPVKPGARLEIGADAWIEALDAATTPVVHPPPLDCGGDEPSSCACRDVGMSGTFILKFPEYRTPDPEQVTVVHSRAVGPYETYTLSTDAEGALDVWLTEHGFGIPEGARPILDDYVAAGFDFIAVRLRPTAGVDQMKPLRVVTPGLVTTFPLRMLSVGVKDTVALSVFVVAEGRVGVQGFPGAELDPAEVTWEFVERRSDYPDVRAAKLSPEGGEAPWLTGYALGATLLTPRQGHELAGPDGVLVDTIADLYFTRAHANGDVAEVCSSTSFEEAALAKDEVVDLCPADDAPCAELGPGEVDARVFTCGEALDDLGVALVGLHPADVWLTRLDARLPVEALANDLELAPGGMLTPPATGEVSNHLFVEKGENGDVACIPGAAQGSGGSAAQGSGGSAAQGAGGTAALAAPPRPSQGGRSRGFETGAACAALVLGLGRRAARRRRRARS
ncbi:DUF2330 domain-containing protein [Sorangium sp. So ce131]|uniref:DUF2330 domain-containing protein n=1 Tax=Sorangium sp. So ce131 TaxID=3133282 RepID=UPI003F5FC294